MYPGIPSLRSVSRWNTQSLLTAVLLTMVLFSVTTFAQQNDSVHYGSGVHGIEQTTVGGYGEVHYGFDTESKDARVNLTRFIIFLAHAFSENISFKSELEVEDAKVAGGEDGGEVALEQAYLDFRVTPSFGVRAGLFIPAIGIINETHEPPTFNGVERPILETSLIPATWREIGIGIFGTIGAADGLSYKLSVVNGLAANGFGGPEGIREGRFEGRDANANSLAVTGRLEYVNQGLKVGGAFYYGGTSAGDTALATGPFGSPLSLFAVDARYNHGNLYLRGVGAAIQVADADKINTLYGSDIGKTLMGWYGEVAYDVLPHFCPGSSSQLLPFVRYETFDLHSSVAAPLVRNEAYDQSYVIAGLTYKPVYNVVVKGDYTLQRNKANVGETNFLRLGIGYSF